MSTLGSALLSISVVMLSVSVLSVLFPNNSHKKHLSFMMKLIIVIVAIGVFSKSIDLGDLRFDNAEKAVGNFSAQNVIRDKICTDIKNYAETAFDIKCKVIMTDDEIVITQSGGSDTALKKAIYEKFGINCRVVTNEHEFAVSTEE